MPNPSRLLGEFWLARAALMILLIVPAVPASEPAPPDGVRFFREKIEPVLKTECYRCHSAQAEKVKGGLLLDSRAGLFKGGDTGPAVVPRKSGESLLIQALRHEDGLAMPPKKPRLPAATLADFAAWIDQEAPDPREGTDNAAEDPRRHWAFQPVRRTSPPRVRDTSWVREPVDAFILAKLEEREWRPSLEASRADWLRRASFDLTGLPPTPEEVAVFVNDPAADAFERAADRLLASPHYGERWARHWLDVVRFAETEGYEYDRPIPDAWRFRDYVIRSLNQDKPFDRFIVEQIAGDEVGPDDPECLVASAFHRLGPVRRNAGNPEIALSRNEVLTERTDIIGAAFLGLSVGCARCHNHKLEPILQKDYYRLQAYFAASDEADVVLASDSDRQTWEARKRAVEEDVKRLKAAAKKAAGAEKERLTAEIEALDDSLPPLATIPATRNHFAKRTPIHVLKRGAWENKGEPAGPRPPGILVADDLPELPADVTDPRTRLARWMTAADHPLTARVLVNRVWQYHFGAGLVRTVNDFGLKGDRPIHPCVLDWLASALVEGGWRLKPIHRVLVLSATYRQASADPSGTPRTEQQTADPENRLLWRFPRRRLSAEEIRDTMLAASGRLNARAGGPSVMTPVDPDLVRLMYKPSQWKVAHDPAEFDRRTIYLFAKRNLQLPFLEAFDAPPLSGKLPERESSTHAPQALELLNGGLSNELAAAFAARLERESGGDPDRFVERAFRLALGRGPTAVERAYSLDYLRGGPTREFALALFNLNGFLYVP